MKRTLAKLAAEGVDTTRWEQTLLWRSADGNVHGTRGCSTNTNQASLPSHPLQDTDQLCVCWRSADPGNEELYDEIDHLLKSEDLLAAATAPGAVNILRKMMYEHHHQKITTPELQAWAKRCRNELAAALKGGSRAGEGSHVLVLEHHNAKWAVNNPRSTPRTLLQAWDPHWQEAMVLRGSEAELVEIDHHLRNVYTIAPHTTSPQPAGHTEIETALALWKDGMELPDALETARKVL